MNVDVMGGSRGGNALASVCFTRIWREGEISPKNSRCIIKDPKLRKADTKLIASSCLFVRPSEQDETDRQVGFLL